MTRRKPAEPGEYAISKDRRPATGLFTVAVHDKATGTRVESYQRLDEEAANAKVAELRVLFPAGRGGRGREGDKMTVRFSDEDRTRILQLATEWNVAEAVVVRDLVTRGLKTL